MNPEQLLAHFDRVSEAPDAIPRLRRFILDLAVRGKLVPQDPNDEPALKLLERILAEKLRMINIGEIGRGRFAQPNDGEASPDSIPSQWCWSQLAEVGILNPRNSAADDLPTSFVPMALISAEYGVTHKHEVRPWGEIKSGYTHIGEGDVALAKITPCFENGKSTVFRNLTGGVGAGTTELHVVRPILICADYILIFLKCSRFIESGIPKMTGTAGQKRVPLEYFACTHFPLPPLAEQHRIVAKVNELMKLCDRLEAVREERERRRDGLAAASLSRIGKTTDDAIAFREHARFHLANLSKFTSRSDQITALRETILRLAFTGRLLPQDASDKPAAGLLERLQEDGKRVTANSRKKKNKPSYSFDMNDESIFLQKGWAWARLGQLADVLNGRAYSKNELLDSGTPVLRVGNLFTSNKWYYSNLELEDDKYCDAGDLLFSWSASFGPFIWSGPRVIYHYHIWKLSIYDSCLIDKKYFYWYLLHKTHEIKSSGHGVSMIHMTKENMEKVIIPLPPRNEQNRIVAKVEGLMALCDRLEVQLTAVKTESHRLLEALLHQALEPTLKEISA